LRLLAASLAVTALLLAGCGGGDDDGAAREILRKGFAASIGTANVSVELTANLEGIPQQRGPVKVKLAGPYRSNGKGKLPDADLDVVISGGGQTFSMGLLSTGERAYVVFGGTPYEVSPATVRRLNSARGGGAGGLGVSPLDWLADASDEGEATVNDVATRHVRADVDVEKTLRDLNRVVARTGAPGRPAPTLDDEQIKSIEDVIDDPKLDVYVGRDDDKIRRFSLDLAFEVPDEDRRRLNGLSSGTVTLDIELTEVGQPQRIEEPESSQPMSELDRLLGGRGIIGLLFGLTTGTPQQNGAGSPTPEQIQAYRECIDAAKPNDAAAIARCRDLLRGGRGAAGARQRQRQRRQVEEAESAARRPEIANWARFAPLSGAK
jgi:hypothetical protein